MIRREVLPPQPAPSVWSVTLPMWPLVIALVMGVSCGATVADRPGPTIHYRSPTPIWNVTDLVNYRGCRPYWIKPGTLCVGSRQRWNGCNWVCELSQ